MQESAKTFGPPDSGAPGALPASAAAREGLLGPLIVDDERRASAEILQEASTPRGCEIRFGSRLGLGPILTPAGMEPARLVETPVGMGAEIVAQTLQQIGRSAGATITVEIGER